jgi:hypothetical protein
MNAKQVYNIETAKSRSLDTVVGIITRLRAKRPINRGSIPGNGKGFISFLKRSDRLWGSYSLLLNG